MNIAHRPFVPPIRPAMPIAAPSRADHGLTSGGIGSGEINSGRINSGITAGSAVNRGDRFAEMLIGEVKQVNEMQMTADGNVNAMLTGGDVSEAEVLTSVQKADLAFRMMLQVRNKLMEAYREIQQIQI